jgi:hypothetical protein
MLESRLQRLGWVWVSVVCALALARPATAASDFDSNLHSTEGTHIKDVNDGNWERIPGNASI